jgi:hypothetical protein
MKRRAKRREMNQSPALERLDELAARVRELAERR